MKVGMTTASATIHGLSERADCQADRRRDREDEDAFIARPPQGWRMEQVS